MAFRRASVIGSMGVEPSAVETVEDNTEGTGASFETRLMMVINIIGSLAALYWMLDEASKGQVTEQVRYRYKRFKARHDKERSFRVAASHAIFEAMRIVEQGA
jgi:hypothetical protein